MKIRYNDKGKYFTDVVSKVPIRVSLQTQSINLEGTMHLHHGNRLIDELNSSSNFIAVTDAVVHKNGEIQEIDFLALGVGKIIWISILEENYAD